MLQIAAGDSRAIAASSIRRSRRSIQSTRGKIRERSDHAKIALHARGYGTADLEHDMPITPATVFNAGSVSKQFGALIVRERQWSPRALAPAYEDAFTDDAMTYLFTRDAGVAVDGLVLSLDRVTRLRFERQGPASCRE